MANTIVTENRNRGNNAPEQMSELLSLRLKNRRLMGWVAKLLEKQAQPCSNCGASPINEGRR